MIVIALAAMSGLILVLAILALRQVRANGRALRETHLALALLMIAEERQRPYVWEDDEESVQFIDAPAIIRRARRAKPVPAAHHA